MIGWYNVTCNNSKHIVPVQRLLFNKYTQWMPQYIDVKDNPISNWGKKVAEMLPEDEYIVFGLDDFLPIDKLDMDKFLDAYHIIKNSDIERFELGWGASKKQGFINRINYTHQDDVNGHKIPYLEYGHATPYKVSTQFSIWKTTALKRELNKCTDAWNFEVTGYCKAACFNDPVLRWIEESVISGRQIGKINLCGLSLKDEADLLNLGLLNKNQIIYGWKGNEQRTKESFGNKYKLYFD
jgi:hypothetical protein